MITEASGPDSWKASGPDGVQGYWIKKLTGLHQKVATQLDDMVNDRVAILAWMTSGKTLLCVNNLEKGYAVENYQPITCLPVMWKLMTGVIADNIYAYMENKNKLPDE